MRTLSSLAGLALASWFTAAPYALEYTQRDKDGHFTKPFVTTSGQGEVVEVYNSTAQMGLWKTVTSWPR